MGSALRRAARQVVTDNYRWQCSMRRAGSDRRPSAVTGTIRVVSHETLRTVLAVAGSVLQLAGFSWAIVTTSLDRYRDFGEAGLPRRGWMRFLGWLSYWLEPEPKIVNAEGRLSAKGEQLRCSQLAA